MTKKNNIYLASASGLLLIPAFPPFDCHLLAWVALVPMFMAVRERNVKQSFMLGMTTGLVFYLGTVYWVYHSMHYYGYLPVVTSVLIVVLLCLYLALFVGAFSVMFSSVNKSLKLPVMITAPLLWVTLEYARTYLLYGFPWVSIGYSQYRFLTLIQFADITGIYGVSFLVVAVNGLLFDLLINREGKGRLTLIAETAVCCLFFIVVLIYGNGRLNEQDERRNIKVSVIQGNIEQDRKWDPKFQNQVIDTYKRLTSEIAKDNPDLIVWPETAVPFIFGYNRELTDDLIAFQKKLATHLIFGGVLAKDINNDSYSKLSNSAVLLLPDGRTASVYDKVHLVPYGEYVPLREIFPFIERLTAGMGDFEPGRELTVMDTPFARIGNLICYEIIFPELARQFVNNGANLLVTITNDGWFGRTSAPYQHFAKAVFRAVENRVPVVRAANTGISGFIDTKGRILKESDIFVEAALSEEIALGGDKSVYTKYGDIFVYICIAAALLMIIGSFIPRREK